VNEISQSTPRMTTRIRAAEGLKTLKYNSEHASWHLRQPVHFFGEVSIENFGIGLSPE
jgi:hypothetical protein